MIEAQLIADKILYNIKTSKPDWGDDCRVIYEEREGEALFRLRVWLDDNPYDASYIFLMAAYLPGITERYFAHRFVAAVAIAASSRDKATLPEATAKTPHC